MDERQVSGFVMATEGCAMILMTSKYSKGEHKYTGPVLAVKGVAGHFAA